MLELETTKHLNQTWRPLEQNLKFLALTSKVKSLAFASKSLVGIRCEAVACRLHALNRKENIGIKVGSKTYGKIFSNFTFTVFFSVKSL